ncbi:hypothetical protein SBOR_4300 [Sclerotinia borealis F-4128]|uniref:Uncharacterized protein n=1 Tax=Sclerotinia borealis (strain F-4128) TaxID=1432307 RepID=W9CLF7_SCLBF|nr:hypothetical protein SBOR_4300 [Sclerotinia borealis F-4128]
MADLQQANPFDILGLLPLMDTTYDVISSGKRSASSFAKKLGEQVLFTLIKINNTADTLYELVRCQGLTYHFCDMRESYSWRSTWNPKSKKPTPIPDWAESLRNFREILDKCWYRGSYEMEHHQWVLRNKIIELETNCQKSAYLLKEKDREIEKQMKLFATTEEELQLSKKANKNLDIHLTMFEHRLKTWSRAESDIQDQIQTSIIKKEQIQTKLTASKDSRKILQEKLEGANIKLEAIYRRLENIIKEQIDSKNRVLLLQPVASGVTDNREEKHQLVTFGDTTNVVDLTSDRDEDIRNSGSSKISERSKPQYNPHDYSIGSNKTTKKVLDRRVTKRWRCTSPKNGR